MYTLNIWRPSVELRSILREGCRYKAYHLATSETKKRNGMSNIQFTATKKTQFQDIEVKLRELIQVVWLESISLQIVLNASMCTCRCFIRVTILYCETGLPRMVQSTFSCKTAREIRRSSEPWIQLSVWRGRHCGIRHLCPGQTRFVSFLFFESV